MIRFLLGVLVGSIATASYAKRRERWAGRTFASGRVDELSSAADSIVADPEFNAGDSTPSSRVRQTETA